MKTIIQNNRKSCVWLVLVLACAIMTTALPPATAQGPYPPYDFRQANMYKPIAGNCEWAVNATKYKTIGDTIIDGNTWLKIYWQDSQSPFDFDLHNAHLFTLCRNDTSNRRVYFLVPPGVRVKKITQNHTQQRKTPNSSSMISHLI